MKNIEKIMSRNIPEIMEKISCFLCKKQDKLFIKIGLVYESLSRPLIHALIHDNYTFATISAHLRGYR